MNFEVRLIDESALDRLDSAIPRAATSRRGGPAATAPRFGDMMWILGDTDAALLLECTRELAPAHPIIAEELETLARLRRPNEKYCLSMWSFFEE